MGGVLGIILLGVFASEAWNPAGADGLLAGKPSFFIVEVLAVALASVWAFGFTYVMLWLIDRVATVRVSAETQDIGLDSGLHGEEAYAGI